MSFYQSKHPDLSIKANAQMSHARRRSQERLGRIVDVKAIAKAIRAGRSQFVERQSNRVSVHIVDGIRVVYDGMRGTVVTILPKEE